MKNLFLFLTALYFPAAVFSQNALTFDGVNDYGTMDGLAAPLTGSTSFTIEFWMKADKNLQTSNIREGMFSVNEPIVGTDNTLLLSFGGMNGMDGHLIIFDGVTAFDIVGTRDIGDNICHHIAYVRSGNTGTAYIDGTVEGTHTADYSFHSANRYSIGQEWDNAVPSDFFHGIIEDLRVWNVARTASDINNNMHNELNGNEAGLLAYYPFNQGVANGANPGLTTIVDFSASGIYGTLNNFALNGTNSNWTSSCSDKGTGVTPNGISDIAQVSAFEIYPSPANQTITINGNFDSPQSFFIRDLSGRTILDFTATSNQQPIDISSLSPGMYFLCNEKTAVRFIKE